MCIFSKHLWLHDSNYPAPAESDTRLTFKRLRVDSRMPALNESRPAT
jgi:hypothetical protein